MRTSKTGRTRKSLKLLGLSRTLGQERGFTLMELMIVILIIGIMLTIVILSYVSGTRKSEVVAATEQVKEIFRYAYSLADSGATTAGVKRQYRLTFHNNTESPPNAVRVDVSTDGGASWNPVVPDSNGGSYKVVSTNWVQLGTPDIVMSYSAPTITYIPRGSILETNPAGDKTVTIGSTYDSGSMKTVTVNDWGSLSE